MSNRKKSIWLVHDQLIVRGRQIRGVAQDKVQVMQVIVERKVYDMTN